MKTLLIFTSSFFFIPWFSRGVSVVSGDLVKDNDKNLLLRLAYIDAPEFDVEDESKCQFFGDSSTIYLQDKLNASVITYTTHYVDQNGQAIVSLYSNGIDINLWMVSNGYAWADHECKEKDILMAMENAKKQKLGLWKFDDHEDPFVFGNRRK